MRKVLQVKILLLLIFSVVLSQYALAGCCTDTCTVVASQSVCANTYSQQDCSELDQCQVGCCCSSIPPRGTTQGACARLYPSSQFLANSSLRLNDACSCYDTATISGFVRNNNQPVAGVTVSSGTRSTTSAADGSFEIRNVARGTNVVVSASSSLCDGSFTIPTLSSDITGVQVSLSCTCSAGCDIDANTYCDGEHQLHEYILSRPDDYESYCNLCADSDFDCRGYDLCKENDGMCPVGCTATQGENYDLECACNANGKNGYCPQSCNSLTDSDCGITFNRVCGDGLVFYPFETCEANPVPGQSLICALGASCNNCNCGGANTCGNGVLDMTEQCELGSVCADGTPCLGCKCSLSCAGTGMVPSLSAAFNMASRSVVLSWPLANDACTSLVTGGFTVMMCKKVGTKLCNDLSEFDSVGQYSMFTSTASILVSQNSNYKFLVKANYQNSIAVSNQVSVATGSDFCMNRGPDMPNQFCILENRSRCDSQNNIVTIENCKQQNKFCSGPNLQGNTACEDVDNCMLCNGLYGSFGKYLDLTLFIGNVNYFCNWEPERMVVPGCFFDKTKYVYDAYMSCNKVRSCYDYKSEISCEDPNDPCSKNSNCEWISLPVNPSLGGICRPKNEQQQDCTLCDNPDYNWISPVCTAQVCDLYGQGCNYMGLNSNPSCAKESVFRCTDYDNIDECIGSDRQAVVVDAVYNSSQSRIGGTHALTRSHDNMSLGKCYWSVNGCKRNADGLNSTPLLGGRSYGFDCDSNDFLCESDFISPHTNITVTSPGGIFRSDPELIYEVFDDRYASNLLKTRFCVVKEGSPACYPTELGVVSGVKKSYVTHDVNVSGNYTVYYYSEDPAKNLEVVKSMRISVDADIPYIYLISPTSESGFITNQQTLPVQARTADDVKYVCVNNTALKKISCINSCNLAHKVNEPCADFSKVFTINVSVGGRSNAASELVFSAEDIAGNKYVNSLIGIIYDIDPPAAPKFYIEVIR